MRSRVLPVLALLVATLIFFMYTKQVYEGSVQMHKQKIAEDESALRAAADYAENASRLLAEKDAMDQDALARLEKMLPDSVDNVQAILDLDGLAESTGIALASIDVSRASALEATEESADQSLVGSVQVSLSGKGTYAAFQKFLKGIETSQRLLDITDLSVSGSDTGVYTYQLSARLYWLR